MSRPLRPATRDDMDRVALAISKLRQARDLLSKAGCPKTAERVRLAITSAGGAYRHVERRVNAPPKPGSLTQLDLL